MRNLGPGAFGADADRPITKQMLESNAPMIHDDEPPESESSRRQALRGGLLQLSERTLVSVVRTAVYGGAATFFALHGAAQVLDAVILGAVLADYVTWLVRSLMQLPENLVHGGYDAAVNLAFAGFFFHVAHFEITDDGSSVAAAFMAFMLVLGIKAGYYGLQSVQQVMSED